MTSDWSCLAGARQGDETAWSALVERYYLPLMKMTSLIVGSLEAAQDVVQETFLKLFHDRMKLRQENLRGFLMTIAYRLALKEKKRRQRHSTIEDRDFTVETPSPLEAAVDQEHQKGVVRALYSLPDSQRNILILRFYGNCSYEEIAALTNVPLGTVKSRLFYAVKACREKLQELEVIL